LVGKHDRRHTSTWGRSLLVACLLTSLSLTVAALAATQAKLVRDINPSGSSDPDEPANVSGMLFFSAYDDDHGTELWKSDGTEGGTKLVKDIRPGGGPGGGSVPLEITSFRGMAFFRAAKDDLGGGYELWRSDGTKHGTRLVKDLDPSTGSEPGDFATVGRTLFFSAHQTSGGYGLWRSNGTKRGTKLVKHVHAEQLTSSGGKLFFHGEDGTHGEELWASDGTRTGTKMLSEGVNPGPDSSYPDYLINVGGTVFFEMYNGSDNWLWKSDGTKPGTKVVKRVDATYSGNVGRTLFFNGDESTHGEELWKSDGTQAGTKLVKDINTTSSGANSFPENFTNAAGTLFFHANDGTHGVELWKSDGTKAGTKLVEDINPAGNSADHEDLTASGGRIYFPAFEVTHGHELWTSDGTTAGTKAIDINPDAGSSNPANLTDLAGTLFLQAEDGSHGTELWKASD
jgi:ELWxxDGT repeat protein